MYPSSTIPVLYVEQCRQLHDGRVCARGPVYNTSFSDWLGDDDKEVQVLEGERGVNYVAHANFSNLLAIAPDEMFGFDPITAEHRFLRAGQNYSCVPIVNDSLRDDIKGSVVLPNGFPACRYERTLRIAIERDDSADRNFLEDAANAPHHERLVWQYQGNASGFLVVPASAVVARGVQNVDCAIVGESDTVEKMDTGADIYGFLRVKDPATLKVVRAEQRLGRIVCVIR